MTKPLLRNPRPHDWDSGVDANTIVIGDGKLEARNDGGGYRQDGELHPDFVEVRRMDGSRMLFVVRLRKCGGWMMF